MVILIIICFMSALCFGGALSSVDRWDNESRKDMAIMYVLLTAGMFGSFGLFFYLIGVYFH